MKLCESIHLHIKVDNANDPDLTRSLADVCELAYSKAGFVKFLHPGRTNLIFSSIPVSEDELVETQCQQRKRPFLDHIGIDLRDESKQVQRVFDAIPVTAKELGWAVASQGREGRGVHCCHAEVGAKHWVYPGESSPPPQVPLEFAFGTLKVNDISGGCDLRPMDPVRKSRGDVGIPVCRE